MKSIEISNFKNFRHLHIDNIGSVNLIVGKNNTGKSTLLEAISILASGGSIGWLRKILEIRGWNCHYDEGLTNSVEAQQLIALCSLFHGRDSVLFKTHQISLKAMGESEEGQQETAVDIRLVDLLSIVETGENGGEYKRLVLKEKFNRHDNIVSGDIRLGISVTSNGGRSVYPLSNFFSRRNFPTDKLKPFEFVKTVEFTGDKNPILFDKIALSPLEKVLIEALRIIDPHITAINYLYDDTRTGMSARQGVDSRVPFVVCDNMNGKYQLSSMGDGINRLLTIVLSMLNCSNGFLLIDEFENGLHYSVQTDLWKLICRLAKELDIQVFATTHSRDCIRSFLTAAADSPESARLIRLESRKDNDVAVVYEDKDEFDYIRNNDIETR